MGGSLVHRLVARTWSSVSRLAGLATGKPDAVYFSLESNAGKALALPLLLLCRMRGLRVFVHHHGYSYVRKHDNLIPLIIRAVPDAVHIFQCEKMAIEFDGRYSRRAPAPLTLTNAFLVAQPRPQPRSLDDASIRLGFMSGSHPVEKGLFRALTVAGSTARHHPTTFEVAGPLDDATSKELSKVAHELNVELVLWGAVRESKAAFFSQLDYLLFPSTYRNETQGIVNLEALSYGTPVLGIDQCCVRETIEPFGGAVFESEAEFLARAPATILSTVESTTAQQRSRTNATKQFSSQFDKSTNELAALLAALLQPTPLVPARSSTSARQLADERVN
ncbi:hypothetical protein DJ018_10535 [Phenylobacterium deserti]|uniref:Glycosyl transferase family 1 domain-containing protein n=2 Tax=Phenylobacterium deserti TaxID=1914756 RepID=A0A328ACZ7_9CAUL|nr:hypothetical protein DJ018_10535 [Phenylobacterium deserti]